eukprot:TRINITY_DN6807_c0_g1_i1.p1 TRINITY_DN6807_c0_g1~~TRINITY_DN6807_c0_g1_i1.p1  ORF type:complete len:581 (-),score=148.54 TRINITY_DN6807_c0_g1_i1:51-1793(-)
MKMMMTSSRASAGALVMLMLVAICALAPTEVAAEGNDYPVVLVHGFLGWGPTELFGYKYWGGTSDTAADLNAQGHHVVTAVVGPFSSVWDRTCELYAQLVGVKVDYGLAHSTQHGHLRFGQDFTGQALLPGLGSDAMPKANFVCHSLGGATCRLLAHLLAHGSEDEQDSGAADVSALFQGDKHWIHTITTLSAPHDGISLLQAEDKALPFAKNLLFALGALAGVGGEGEAEVYDFKMQQWGLERMEGESFTAYSDRVFASSAFGPDNQDTALTDLSVKGAFALNGYVAAEPDIYYLSYSTVATYRSPFSKHQLPELFTFPGCWSASTVIGSYTGEVPGITDITSAWWPNDCLVSQVSQTWPKVGSVDAGQNFDGTFVRGAWSFMANFPSWDHFDIVGMGDKNIKYKARDLVSLLMTIPDPDAAPATAGKRAMQDFVLTGDEFDALLHARVSAGATVDKANNAATQRAAFVALCQEASSDISEEDCEAMEEQLSSFDTDSAFVEPACSQESDGDTTDACACDIADLKRMQKKLSKQRSESSFTSCASTGAASSLVSSGGGAVVGLLLSLSCALAVHALTVM